MTAPFLTREAVFDAIRDHATYATTQRRIYLDVRAEPTRNGLTVAVTAASEEGVVEASIVANGGDVGALRPDDNPRVLRDRKTTVHVDPGGFCYVRIITDRGNMAWSSPVWV